MSKRKKLDDVLKAPKVEGAKVEGAKVEEAKVEEAKVEEAKVEYSALVNLGGIGRVFVVGKNISPRRIKGGVETLEKLYKRGLVAKNGKKIGDE